MTDMIETKVKAFKKDGDYIRLYEDSEGKQEVLTLPLWMFNKMVETFFDVRVKS